MWEQADDAVDTDYKPVYDQAVEDGAIAGWGWMAHHTGGKWRRTLYHTASSMEGLLSGAETVGQMRDEKMGDSDGVSKACRSHDDYIWRSVAGSGRGVLTAPRGKVGLSAYHVCEMSKESRADELIKAVFAPVYDAHVGPEKLSSWGWSEHIVGGKYRRLATMTAEDWPTLLEMSESIFSELEDNELGDEFVEICGSHSDYLWEIRHASP